MQTPNSTSFVNGLRTIAEQGGMVWRVEPPERNRHPEQEKEAQAEPARPPSLRR